MAGNFVESPKRPSKLIFVVLNFVIATSIRAWHCTSVIDSYMRTISLAIFFVLSHAYLDK